MLSRTAENLFWIGRYMERAEASARLLDVGARNALLPNIGGGYRNEWESILEASGTLPAFKEKYGDPVQRNVESHMFFDKDNPSSILSCITAARENGRIVRTAITGQVWDALNTAFQEIREMQRTERSQLPLADLVDPANLRKAPQKIYQLRANTREVIQHIHRLRFVAILVMICI